MATIDSRAMRAGAMLVGVAIGLAAGAAELAPAPTEQDRVWLLGAPPEPADNRSTPERIELGKALFFDPRLSGNGTVSCGTCHNPALGWSDGLRTGVGINGTVLGRATPTVVNTAGRRNSRSACRALGGSEDRAYVSKHAAGVPGREGSYER
jgi:cytochrome c peroxidase